MTFSDYLIFADESGDHGLERIDPDFPVFALVLALVHKDDYVERIVPAFQALKLRYWGHDNVIFHERDIRKSLGAFGWLRTDRRRRDAFLGELTGLMAQMPITLYAAVIDKRRLTARYRYPFDPYHISLQFCLERLDPRLRQQKQAGRIVHVLFESRGKREDAELLEEFTAITGNWRHWGWRRQAFGRITYRPEFVAKERNCTGLQLVDLAARPIAQSYLRPEQKNGPYETIVERIAAQKAFP